MTLNPQTWRPRWLDEIGYPGLLVALVVQIVLDPILDDRPGERLLPLIYLFVIVVALVVSSPRRSTLRIGLALAIVPTVFVVLQLLRSDRSLVWEITLVSVSAAYALAAVSVLRDVWRERQDTGDRVMGALAAYLLFGMAWAFLYVVLWSVDATAFQLPATDLAAEEGLSDVHPFVYFSFVTLTTLGYGDILPVSSTTRMVAFAQAVFGQLYIAVVLARLVALELQDRHGKG